jgi:hypothetical protein
LEGNPDPKGRLALTIVGIIILIILILLAIYLFQRVRGGSARRY